jgi:succinate dehydrogenase/fumarate reductase flavoprotein subunit
MSSGTYAGRGAARFARAAAGPPPPGQPLGQAGLRPTATAATDLDPAEVIALAQGHVLPPSRSYSRDPSVLATSRSELESVWRLSVAHLHGVGRDVLKARQAASLVAHARWITASSLARTETRGMHRRVDAPGRDPRLDHRILVGGLDSVWTRPDDRAPRLAGATVGPDLPGRPVARDRAELLDRRAS